MRRKTTRSTGFTMIEAVIVIAVVAILAAVLVPMIGQNIESARNARAASDVATVGKAIVQFRQDTSLWPIYDPGTGNAMNLLYSDAASPIPPTWSVSSLGQNLSMVTHLMAYNIGIKNIQEGPSRDGSAAWNGPYLSGLTGDPWGNSYVVNCLHLNTGSGNVYVLSAGPGRPANIETPFSGAPPAGTDDIYFQIQ